MMNMFFFLTLWLIPFIISQEETPFTQLEEQQLASSCIFKAVINHNGECSFQLNISSQNLQIDESYLLVSSEYCYESILSKDKSMISTAEEINFIKCSIVVFDESKECFQQSVPLSSIFQIQTTQFFSSIQLLIPHFQLGLFQDTTQLIPFKESNFQKVCIPLEYRILAACSSTQFQLLDNSCQSCDTSCKTCSNFSTNCLTCDNGKYLDLSYNICSLCNIECLTCQNTPNNCLSCSSQAFLNGSTCTSCSLLCKTCTSLTVCTSCYNGYFVDSLNSNTCSPCSQGCLTCTSNSSTACSICFPGYYLNSNQCIKCQNKCKTCSNATSCDSCFDNFQYSSNDCLPCPSSCTSCTPNTTNCLTCIDRYYINSNSCDQCNIVCIICTGSSNSQCGSCITGYHLFGTTCTACPTGCTSCTSSTACNACIYGYYLDSSSLCQVCPSPCQTCQIFSGSTVQCNSCFDRSILNLSSPQTCEVCSNYCQICTSSSNCTTCMQSYYLKADFTCTKCINNCDTCSSDTTCLTCLIGFYMTGTNTCIACSSNCKTCTSPTVCTQCQSGYYINGSNSCNACDPSCESCSGSSSNCTNCFNNFQQNSNQCNPQCGGSGWCNTQNGCINPSGSSCKDCDPTCKECSAETSSTDCTVCLSGSYLTSSNTCVRISQFECKSLSGTCTACYNSFQVNSSNICIQDNCDSDQYFSNGVCSDCPLGCLTCSSSTTCSSCETSNFYTNPLCVPCNFPCSTCNTSSGACTACLSGYKLSGGSCNLISYPCLSVSGSNCNACATGFYLDGSNNCQLCSTQCKTCSGPTLATCTSCWDGFYLDPSSQFCLRCRYNCSTCTDGISCTACSSATTRDTSPNCLCKSSFYETYAESCLACTSPCQTCSDNTTTCTSCVGSTLILIGSSCLCPTNGYFYQNGTCMVCDSSCKECFGIGSEDCISCNAPFIFDSFYQSCQCPTGYYASGNTCILCPLRCTSCSSISCQSCQKNSDLSLGSCNCSLGYTWDPVSFSCKETPFTFFCSPIPSQTSTYTCSICHYSCLTCYGFENNNCQTCNSSRTYDSTTQICRCNSGLYDDPASESCKLCHYSCSECIGPSSFDCTLCNNLTWFRIKDMTTTQNNNVYECPCQTSYYDAKVHICSHCDTSCATCIGNSYYCLTCPVSTPAKILNSQNICTCPLQYFNEISSNTCKSCHYSCFNCIDGTVNGCVSCALGSLRHDNKLILVNIQFQCLCPPFYYDDGINALCIPCHYSCTDCNGPLSSDCTNCGKKSLLYRQLSLLGITNGTCDCVSGFRDDLINKQCVPCPYQCATCDAASNCLSCMPTRIGATCICNSSTFETGVPTCQGCSNLCGSCFIDQYYCLSCIITDFRTLNNINKCVCQDGYFDLSVYNIGTGIPISEVTTCIKCKNNCKTCTSNSLNSCMSCFSTYNFYLTKEGSCLCIYGYRYNNGVCEDTYALNNQFLNEDDRIFYTDIFRYLLTALIIFTWIHLLFNQPFQSSMGFRAHQILLMKLFTNSKINAYIYSSLNLVLEISPFYIFNFGKIISSPYDDDSCINGKILDLSQSCRILESSQGLIISLITFSLLYLLLRFSIFRDSVRFPNKIYLQVKWRYQLNLFYKQQMYPFFAIISQTIMMRLYFYAIVDLMSTSVISFSTAISFIIVTLNTFYLIFLFYSLLQSKADNLKLKNFFFFELKPELKYFFFFQICSDYIITLFYGIYGSDSSTQIMFQFLSILGSCFLLLLYRPFLFLWENIISIIETGLYAISFYLLATSTQMTYTLEMSDQESKDFNKTAKIYFYVLCFAVIFSIFSILLRIFKGIIRVIPIIGEIISRHSINGLKWHQLWELQDEYPKRHKQTHCQAIVDTKDSLINREILKEFLNLYSRSRSSQSPLQQSFKQTKIIELKKK